MRRLHIHSDNANWAGSENMPSIFLSNEDIKSNFELSFSYRDSESYKKGMNKWVKNNNAALYPMKLWISYLYKIRKYFKPIMVFKYFFMMEEIIKFIILFYKINPDVLHVNNGGFPATTSCNSAVIAGKIVGIPKITYMINSTAIEHIWEKPLNWIIKKCVTKFISASYYLRDTTDFLFEGKNWEVIPNTIRYKEPEATKEEIRKYFGVEEEECFILGLGNLEKRKGFQNLNCFSEYLDSEVKIVIYGDGEEKENIQRRIKGSKKTELFTESPFHDYDIINACDIFVLPSIKDEDFPNVLLIALMYGKPIVSSNLAGIPEIMEGVNIPYESFNPFISLYKTIDDYYSIAKKAKQKFKSCYKEDFIISEYINLWTR